MSKNKVTKNVGTDKAKGPDKETKVDTKEKVDKNVDKDKETKNISFINGKIKIFCSTNLKFGIYWIDAGVTRTFTKDEFLKNKPLCHEFDEGIKKGIIKIVR